jgi:hypothetical protein
MVIGIQFNSAESVPVLYILWEGSNNPLKVPYTKCEYREGLNIYWNPIGINIPVLGLLKLTAIKVGGEHKLQHKSPK